MGCCMGSSRAHAERRHGSPSLLHSNTNGWHTADSHTGYASARTGTAGAGAGAGSPGGGGTAGAGFVPPEAPTKTVAQFKDDYELLNTVGQGSSSKCYRCRHRQTNKLFAVKVLDKRKLAAQSAQLVSQLLREIRILRTLEHHSIVKLYDVYEDENSLYVVMSYVGGGELFDYVISRGKLSEREAAAIVRQLLSAVVYLHERHILHRDLKPENLLLVSPINTVSPQIKLIDFGSSIRVNRQGGSASTMLGTLGYVAPEVLKGKAYTGAVDLWGVGVITFVLLCGCFPFNQNNVKVVKRKAYKLRWPGWATSLSEDARDFVKTLLDYSPAKRGTAASMLRHPWLSGRAPATPLASPHRLGSLHRTARDATPRGAYAAARAAELGSSNLSGGPMGMPIGSAPV